MGNYARQPLTEAELNSVYESLLRYWTKKGLRQDAEDLAQEGVRKCLLAYGKWDSREGWSGKRASMKTFLIRVAINSGNDYLRKEAGQSKIKQRVFDIFETTLSLNVSPNQSSVDGEWPS